MIGDVIAAALPQLRAQARSLMVDDVTITRDGGEPVYDPDLDDMVGGVVAVHVGLGRLIRAEGGSAVDAAGEAIQAAPYVVAVPHDVTGVRDGDRVAVGGLDLRVRSVRTGTHAIELRLLCTEYA